MLKGISPLLSPELLKILCEMGHGDELVIGDGNFPAAANAKRLVRADGVGVPALLEAILPLFPLDSYVDEPVLLMATTAGDPTPEIWQTYDEQIKTLGGGAKIGQIDRFAFYERARNAYAVVASGESAVYANVILKKGVVK